MRKWLPFIIVFCVLLFLAIAQTIVDYIKESNQKMPVSLEKDEYCVFVDIEDKTLYLLQSGKCIKKYPVASGASGLPSPLGYWHIVSKGDWGEGFGGRWMGLDVPWGTYGIHGTTYDESIGSASSHGCIRMFNSDIIELYSMVPAGTPVSIVNGCFGPFGTGFSDINPGDRGADVLAIQKRLKALGYFRGDSSGIYEDDLKVALHKFQQDKGLEVKNTITKKDYFALGFSDFE